MTTMLIPIELLSSRVCLSLEHQKHLFGEAHGMEILRSRTGRKGQFVYKETVRMVGPKEIFLHLPIVGPSWEETHVELAPKDAKLFAPTSLVTLQGSAGVVKLKMGMVAAGSSLYCNLEEAERLGVHNGDCVELCLADKPTVGFEHVEVRVHPTYALLAELCLEPSEAFDVHSGEMAQLVIS